MATQRLPIPGEDKGNWGEILNEYLLVAHNNDGTLKAESVILGKANKTYVDAELANKANTADLSAVATSGSFNDLTDVPAGSDFSTLVTLAGTQTITGEKNFTGGLKIAGSVAVATNDARLSDTRTPSDDSVATNKVQDEAITEPKLAVSNAPANGNFLSWNGSNLAWQAQQSAPVTSVNTRTGDVVVTKSDVGLGSVDNTSDAGKPISTATQTALDLKANAASTQTALDSKADAAATQTALDAKANTSSLSTVATSGSYSNLLDKPTLSTVAATGAYSDLTGKPTYSTVATSGSYADLTNKPSLSTVATTGSYSDLTNRPTLSTVATTGAYGDLTGRPTIPSAGTSSSTYAVGDDSRITGALQRSVATTKGDIFVATSSATVGRVGVGANNQVLTADSSQASGVKWADAAAGTTGINRSVHVISANETAASAAKTDYVYVFSSPATLTLPAVSGSGNAYVIKNFSGGLATVAAVGGDVIDGETQMILQHTQSYTLYDVGSSAWIVT